MQTVLFVSEDEINPLVKMCRHVITFKGCPMESNEFSRII